MEKKNPACKKTAAVTTSPAVRVLRYGSFSRPHSGPAKNGEDYSTSGMVPVKFDHSIPKSNGERKIAIPAAALVKPHQANHENTIPRKHDTYDPFSDYIRRAKLTIRTLTFAGGGRNAAAVAAASLDDDADEPKKKKEDNRDNNFSDFIRRARMRIRTSSNLGRGKSTSFKRE